MILQEREICMFNRNLSKSSGRGPSKGERNSKDRKEQMKVAEDFVNILDGEQAIQMEAEQAMNPCTFIPRGNSKHKPPKSIEIYDEQGEDQTGKKSKKEQTGKKGKKANQRKLQQKHNQRKLQGERKKTTPDIDDARFTEKLALATEVIVLDNTDEDEAATSQQPQQQVLPTGLAQYVPRKPPVIINPVG